MNWLEHLEFLETDGQLQLSPMRLFVIAIHLSMWAETPGSTNGPFTLFSESGKLREVQNEACEALQKDLQVLRIKASLSNQGRDTSMGISVPDADKETNESGNAKYRIFTGALAYCYRNHLGYVDKL